MGWYDQVQVQAPQATGYGVAAQLMSESNKGIQDAIKTGGNYFANEAVKKLIADKPSGTVDPTEHIGKINSLIGYMTPEQAQAYRDYGSAMQTSYGRNLEEGRFNKSQEQSQKQFEAGQQLQKELTKSQLDNALKVAGIHAGSAYNVAKMNLDAMAPVREAQALENLTKAQQVELSNEIKKNPNGPAATLMRSSQLVEDFRKKPISFEDFKKNYDASGWLHFNLDSTKQSAYNKAMQLLNQPVSTPQQYAVQTKVDALLRSGDVGGINALFSK